MSCASPLKLGPLHSKFLDIDNRKNSTNTGKMRELKVAITGSDGFVGRYLCERLQTNYSLIRGTRNPSISGCFNYGDISACKDWGNFLTGAFAVVHLAAKVHDMLGSTSRDNYIKINTDATVKLAKDAKKLGVKRFIFLSTIKVNGESTSGVPFSASDKVAPTDHYSESKFLAERELLRLHEPGVFEVVVIRPPLIYGNGVKANFLSLINAVRKRFPFPFGLVNNRRSLLYVKNLVSLIEKCLESPRASGETFLVSDGSNISLRRLILIIARALGVKAIIFPVPVFLMKFFAILVNKRDLPPKLFADLEVDIEKTKTILDWSPPFTTDQAIMDMLNPANQPTKSSGTD